MWHMWLGLIVCGAVWQLVMGLKEVEKVLVSVHGAAGCKGAWSAFVIRQIEQHLLAVHFGHCKHGCIPLNACS